MRITAVKYLGGYKLLLTFNGKGEKEVDLKGFMDEQRWNPLINKYRDKKLFARVKIDDGHLRWSSQFDMSAHGLYDKDYLKKAKRICKGDTIKIGKLSGVSKDVFEYLKSVSAK